MPRRRRGRWMVKGTDPILELLEEMGPLPIGKLDLEVDAAKSTIARALDELEQRSYIKPNDQYTSFYEITDRGPEYLRGERDARDDE